LTERDTSIATHSSRPECAVVCRCGEDGRMKMLGVVGPEVSGPTRTLEGGLDETQGWAKMDFSIAARC
jgi:hypothetical protein